MDFRRDRDPKIAEEFRAFLSEALPEGVKSARFEWSFDWDFHRALLAWQQSHLAKANDGAMQTFADEVMWADLDLRTVGTTGLVSRILSAVGTEQQKATLIPMFARGDGLAALGYTEPDSGSDVAAAKTRAVRDGDEWIINGQKMFTSNAEIATHVFLLTRTNTQVPKHRGLTTFIVPLDAPGVEIRPIQTLRGHATTMTYYTDVRVPDSYRVGDVDGGWSVMRSALDLEHGSGPAAVDAKVADALSYGARLTHLLSRVVVWASGSTENDGARAIDDPALRRGIASAAIDVEVARLLKGRTDPEAALPGVGNGSKLFSSEAYLRHASALLDLVGVEALPDYSSADSPADGWIEYSFRDSPVATIAGGSSEVQRDVIAERRLGLPTTRTMNRQKSEQ